MQHDTCINTYDTVLGATIHSANGLYLQFTKRLPTSVEHGPEIASTEHNMKDGNCPFHNGVVQ